MRQGGSAASERSFDAMESRLLKSLHGMLGKFVGVSGAGGLCGMQSYVSDFRCGGQ